MKTFPSYDNTLCGSEDCSKRQSCVRFLTLQKAKAEKYEYPLMVFAGEPAECKYYIKAT